MRITPLSAVIYGTTTEYYRKMQKNAEWSFGLERWGKNQESVGEDLGTTSLIYKDGTRNRILQILIRWISLVIQRQRKPIPTAMQCYSQELSIG